MAQTTIIPTWIQILSALLVPLIALVTTTIIILQYILAKQRWRLDLYDKRYPIHLATMSYISIILQDARITNEELMKFLRTSRDKHFLFGKDVEKLLDELYKKGVELRCCQDILESRSSPEDKRLRLIDKQEVLILWFKDQYGVATATFKKYLSIDKK